MVAFPTGGNLAKADYVTSKLLAAKGSTPSDLKDVPLTELLFKDAFGNFALGVAGDAKARLQVNGPVSTPGGATPTGAFLLTDTGATGMALEAGVLSSGLGGWIQARAWNVAAPGDLQLNPMGGNVLVGVAAGSFHRIIRSVAENNAVLEVGGTSGGTLFAPANTTGANGLAAAQFVNKTSANRSINAAGTINASGADYAEYMTKAEGCGMIAKGDVCGVDADGLLTDQWADAIGFVVKSTDPSYVGGDKWGVHLGMRPEPPAPIGAEPEMPEPPPAFTDPMPEREAGESDENFVQRVAEWGAVYTVAYQAQTAYQAAVEAYPTLRAGWLAEKASYDAALAEYDIALPAWEAALEQARAQVDRIAFSGQVPVNFEGDCAPGDYLVAVEDGAGIGLAAVAVAEMTLVKYMRRVGRVWAIRDGRPWVDVQHG